MRDRLDFALQAAYEAGRSTLALFNTRPEVELKRDASPVTAADRHAEALIRQRIRETFPGEAILGEEEGTSGDSLTRWVIDPIDGTKSFISGVPLYATLLSYEIEGEPVVGVCYFPALDEMLCAVKGEGARWNGRSCRVRTNADPGQAVVCVGGHSAMAKRGALEPFGRLAIQVLATRTWCDAYGHALVATGRVDAMVDPIVAHYDTSAVSLIVREAGGRFTDWGGNDPLTNEAISSNGELHDWILSELA